MPITHKRGVLHNEEKDYIRTNANILSPAQIAAHLNRNEATVKAFIMREMKLQVDDTPEDRIAQMALVHELKNSPEWSILQDELTEKELKYFRHRYGKLMAQFNQDGILPTEETQVFTLIKYEILMNRNMRDRKRSVEEIERLENILEDTYQANPHPKAMTDQEKQFLLNLENQLLAARTANQNKSTEYVKLTEKHSSLLKELKGTRDQRIDKLNSTKEKFIDIIVMLQDEEIRKREGRHLDLVNIAVKKEKDRLSDYHTYIDGSVDQPLLTPETVK